MSFEQRGVFAARSTPVLYDLSLNSPKFDAHCRNLFEKGCDSQMSIGRTSEGHAFTVEQNIAMMDSLAERGITNKIMLFGTSVLAYPDAIQLIKYAVSIGLSGVCLHLLFYCRLEDVGLVEFFDCVIDTAGDSRMRLHIYDTETNLRIHFSLELLSQLFVRFPNTLAGEKDRNANLNLLKARCNIFLGKKFFSGTAGMAPTALRAGGNGVLSSLSNIHRALLRWFMRTGKPVTQPRRWFASMKYGRPLTAFRLFHYFDRPRCCFRAMRERLTALGLTPTQLAAE